VVQPGAAQDAEQEQQPSLSGERPGRGMAASEPRHRGSPWRCQAGAL